MAISTPYKTRTITWDAPASSGSSQTLSAINNMYSGLANQSWMNQDAANNARIYQNQAKNYVSNLVDQQTKLQNYANKQIENRQKTSEKMFAGMMNQYQGDPMFGYLRSAITDYMKNPGLSDSTMRKLQAQAQARAAADLAGGMRSNARAASAYGMTGQQASDADWAARSRSGRSLNESLLNLNLQNEQMKNSNRSQAISSAGSLMNNYWGNLQNMGNSYANLLASYNPQVAPMNTYDAMQQVYANPHYGTQTQSYNPYAALFGNSY